MGRVYKVFDTKIKEKVALKLIKQEVASDQETIETRRATLKLNSSSHAQVARSTGRESLLLFAFSWGFPEAGWLSLDQRAGGVKAPSTPFYLENGT
jgi:hypothetical protein